MKVTKVETHLAGQYTFVRVLTDEDLYGVGEVHPASGTGGTAFTVRGAIEYCAEYLIGKDPLEIERHWQHMFRRSIFRGGADVMAAIGGIDMALWDIAGKAVALPIHKLLGGPTRDRVRVYAHIDGDTSEALAEDARAKVDQGYTAVRFYPLGAFNDAIPTSVLGLVQTVVTRVEAVRQAVGPEVDLMIDVVNRLTPPEAIAVGHAVEPYGLYFFEDPIEADNIDAMAQVASSIRVPVATGERLYTIYQFRELFNKNAAAYARPDLSLAGGITNCKKIAALAEASYVGVVPHNPLSPVLTAACVQLCAATHNIAMQEYRPTEHESPKSELVDEPLSVKNGHLVVPDRPGLGIDLNLEAFKHHPPTKRPRPALTTSDGALREY
jgi:galactonate dehydratase